MPRTVIFTREPERETYEMQVFEGKQCTEHRKDRSYEWCLLAEHVEAAKYGTAVYWYHRGPDPDLPAALRSKIDDAMISIDARSTDHDSTGSETLHQES